jgi:hypothetical protein
MSICYDFQKWTMITLASVVVSLTVDLLLLSVNIHMVHGILAQVPRMDTIDDALSFCRLFPGVDITEGIQKGNLSQLFKSDTTCKDFKEAAKLRDDIKDAFTLDELQKQNEK